MKLNRSSVKQKKKEVTQSTLQMKSAYALIDEYCAPRNRHERRLVAKLDRRKPK
jgi:hypothetical protein